jgi:hypothetical protein
VSINGSPILLKHVDDLGITTPTEKELDEIEQKIEHVELEEGIKKDSSEWKSQSQAMKYG